MPRLVKCSPPGWHSCFSPSRICTSRSTGYGLRATGYGLRATVQEQRQQKIVQDVNQVYRATTYRKKVLLALPLYYPPLVFTIKIFSYHFVNIFNYDSASVCLFYFILLFFSSSLYFFSSIPC
jgi:hypothetical protein